MKQIKNKKNRKAFTLVEIVIVIALIVGLAGLAISKVGGILGTGQVDIAKVFVNSQLQTPLMAYRVAMGTYPSTEEGLEALIKAPESAGDRWKGPYLAKKEIPKDPWGSPYKYAFPGVNNPDEYDLWSIGPDKKDGTDDDIGNWTKESKK